MLMKDNKKIAATLIASSKPAEAPQAEGAEQEADQHTIAADEIMAAISAQDSKALSEALKAFYEMCASQDYQE